MTSEARAREIPSSSLNDSRVLGGCASVLSRAVVRPAVGAAASLALASSDNPTRVAHAFRSSSAVATSKLHFRGATGTFRSFINGRLLHQADSKTPRRNAAASQPGKHTSDKKASRRESASKAKPKNDVARGITWSEAKRTLRNWRARWKRLKGRRKRRKDERANATAPQDSRS